MEIRQMRYFVRIADMGSMSRAAVALHVTQPSLSHQMSQLESEVGGLLLTRLPTGVRMTAQGEIFYREAVEILRQLDDLPGKVTAARSRISGRVRIAMVPTQAMQYALPLILDVRSRFPGIGLEVFDNTSSDVMQGITSGRRDLGVLIREEDAKLIDAEPIAEEELLLVSHPSHAPSGGAVKRSELTRLPLIVPSTDQLGLLHWEGMGRSAAGDPLPESWIVANSVGLFRQAAMRGIAHALQPWGALADELGAGALRATPIDPPLMRTVYLGTARGAALSEAARVVRQALLDVIAAAHAQRSPVGTLRRPVTNTPSSPPRSCG